MLRVRAADIAKEIVQETFLSLWMRREAIEVGTDLAVYLAVAVRNRTRDFRAHEDVVAHTDDAILSGAMRNPVLGEPTPRPDVETERADFREAYERALAVLDEREREAVLLRWDEGYTLERIGRVLGISKMGAHKIVARAQAKVQRLLSAYDPRP
jgi:RNA polymerase sigma-70 factor (ECF subfamily)